MNKYEWKVVIHLVTPKGTKQTSTIVASELIDVTRILMTFKPHRNATVYRYEIEKVETLI